MEHQDTELRLGLPGTNGSKSVNKRSFIHIEQDSTSNANDCATTDKAPPSKAQVVGWPPVRSYRKNSIQAVKLKEVENGGMYVKVSMDGAPFLRKIDMKLYSCYEDLLNALADMFKVLVGCYSEGEGYNGSEYVATYEDKDEDWMLVGDVPWEMFTNSCKRLRIMKGSDAKGLACSS